MRAAENYTRYVVAGLLLTLAIGLVFQVYLFSEPARITRVEAADRERARAAGAALYRENCAACHGEEGEGQVGPALNSKELLRATPDEVLFSLIRTGVPGTVMPAWGQAFGGPLTDEQVSQVVASIRGWEATAPEILPVTMEADSVRGATIFAETCFVCHGENGLGTERAPRLNDPATLTDFDDAWYRNTISHGRPAQGMPTWGTVLSPSQIDDVVALIAAWREGVAVMPQISMKRHLRSALFAVQQFDQPDAEFHLQLALEQADPTQARSIRAILRALREKDWGGAQEALLEFLPPEEIGTELFLVNCSACHGATGLGGLGKNLHDNTFIQGRADEALIDFILEGRPGTAMDGFARTLSREDITFLISLLRSWQE
ncbi:MAG TPA: c-type cytochrome [Candidatus Methylomirabilis sp.]